MQIQAIDQILDDISALESVLKEKLERLPNDKAMELISDMITDLEAIHDLLEEQQ